MFCPLVTQLVQRHVFVCVPCICDWHYFFPGPGWIGSDCCRVFSDQGLFFFLENISCMSVFVAFLRLLFLNLTESALLKQGQIWQPYMGQS